MCPKICDGHFANNIFPSTPVVVGVSAFASVPIFVSIPSGTGPCCYWFLDVVDFPVIAGGSGVCGGSGFIHEGSGFIRNITIWYNSHDGLISLVRASRHLSGAARAYIPLSILRLPYTSHLST